MERFDQIVNNYLPFLNNEYVSAALTILVVLYGGLAAPKLPNRVAQLFNSKLFRILVLALIAMATKKNPSVAVVAAVAVMVIMSSFNKLESRMKTAYSASENMDGLNTEHVEAPLIDNVQLAELQEVNDEVDYRNDFYPQDAEYSNAHENRHETEEISAYEGKESHAEF